MTATEELSALETTYQAWLEAGCPQSYTTKLGVSVTRASAEWMSKRIDMLRAQVNQQTSGQFWVGQTRDSD